MHYTVQKNDKAVKKYATLKLSFERNPKNFLIRYTLLHTFGHLQYNYVKAIIF